MSEDYTATLEHRPDPPAPVAMACFGCIAYAKQDAALCRELRNDHACQKILSAEALDTYEALRMPLPPLPEAPPPAPEPEGMILVGEPWARRATNAMKACAAISEYLFWSALDRHCVLTPKRTIIQIRLIPNSLTVLWQRKDRIWLTPCFCLS
jgi:hypothetical protein